MRRLTLLVLALSLAAVAQVAQAAPVVHGGHTVRVAFPGDRDGDGNPDSSDQCPDAPGGYNGCPTPPDRDGDGLLDSQDMCPDTPGSANNQGCPPTAQQLDSDGDLLPDYLDPCPAVFGRNNGCPPPADRDGDSFPDATDRCPDEWAGSGLQGCPKSYDRDGDGVLNMDDACPDTPSHELPNGCQRFVWKYFFGTQSAKDFAADKPNDTTWCSGLVKCKTTHVTFTLSAASAKAAHITNRRIGTIAVTVPKFAGFDRGISSVNQKKLAKLKSITVTIHAWVILATGKRIDAAEKTLTIKGYAAHQFNSDNNHGNEI